ncbi:SBBP repeat-containing protein [Archangium gephyra]|uniref:SBBP repeat-containing protein n=1 Tax=Archangium gephyra TaxID=48 RepID=UPI0035D507D3
MSLRMGVVLTCGLLTAGLGGCKDPGDGGGGDGGVPSSCIRWSSDGMSWGTDAYDELIDVAIDGKGNVYMAGYDNGTVGQENVEPSGNARGVLLKIEPDGLDEMGMEAPWSHVIDTAGSDVIEALTVHPGTGEVLFAGRTRGSLPGFQNQGQYDLFIGALSETQAPSVLLQTGTERPQHPRRIGVDGKGDIVVSGYDDIYIPSNYVDSWEDPFVAKFHREGQSLTGVWTNQFNSSFPDLLNGLAVETKGESSIYVSGANLAGASKGMFVGKLTADGKPLWFKLQSQIAVDMAQAVQTLSDGNVLFAGSTFAKLGDRAYGQQDVVVRKLDAQTGEPLWTKQYGSLESEWVTDMALDAEGNIYVVGETLGSFEQGYTHRGEFDVFMLKLDPNGNLLYIKQWGTEGDDHPSAVAVDTCGRMVVAGYTTGGAAAGHGRDALVITASSGSSHIQGGVGEQSEP